MPTPSTDSGHFVEVDAEVLRYLSTKRKAPGESIASVLRRELRIPPTKARKRKPKAKSDSKRGRVSSDKRATQLVTYVEKSSFAYFKTTTEKYIAVLSFLYKQNGKSFASVLTIGGIHRRYFGRSPGEIAFSGRGTQPHAIEGSPYWALTNVNQAKKQEILARVLVRLGYDRVTVRKVSSSLVT